MSFRRFMKQNVKPSENEFHAISPRFTDENGEALLFEFRTPLASDVDRARDCATRITRKGEPEKVDGTKLMHTLIEMAMVTPDLSDKELQDSYGVLGVSELIGTMFTAGEYAKVSDIIGKLAGFDESDKDLIEDAKNS